VAPGEIAEGALPDDRSVGVREVLRAEGERAAADTAAVLERGSRFVESLLEAGRRWRV